MANQVSNVSFSNPGFDYGSDLASIERKRKLAEALQTQSAQPLETQTAGGWAIPLSPLQGLAKMAQAGAAVYGNKKADEQQRDLTTKYQGDAQRVLSESLGALSGTPGKTIQPDPQEAQQSADQGTPTVGPAVTPGQAPDPMRALSIALQHPQAAQVVTPLAEQAIQQQQGQQAIEQALAGRAANPMAAGGGSVMAPTGGAPATNNQAAVIDALMRSPNPQAQAYGKFLSAQAELEQKHAHERDALAQADRHWANPSASQTASNTLAREHLAETRRHNSATEGDPTTIESTAQAIAKGELAPLGGFALARPQGREIMARVAAIAQESGKPYDPTQFATRQKSEKDFATGKQGTAVRSFNVALSHLDTLDGLADALHNGNAQLINRASNAVATQTGSAAPTNFAAAKKIVADEIVKAIVGSGGGVSDREEAAKTINAANSPAQLKGVINTYKELMRGQLGGLRQQYETSTGKKDFDKFLSDSAKVQAHGSDKQSPEVDALIRKYAG